MRRHPLHHHQVKSKLIFPFLHWSRDTRPQPLPKEPTVAHTEAWQGPLAGQSCRMNNLPPETYDPWTPAGLKVPVADGSLCRVSAELKWENLMKVPWVQGKATASLADK